MRLVTVNAKKIVGSITTRGSRIFNIFIFFALVSKQTAALSSVTQHKQCL